MTLNFPAHLHFPKKMRFNSDTERAINIDEIAAQCKAAILKSKQPKVDLHAEILEFARWADDVLIPA